MNNKIDLKVQNAWETIAKFLAEQEHATTFFIDGVFDKSMQYDSELNDFYYKINFINEKGEFIELLRSNNVTTLNKVVEKNDKKSELKVGESV
jgi:inhibitor of KinA sporulation pathway (predicted exonuclease)